MTGRGWRLPDLTGRRAIVTGASSGLGAVTAIELATAGARVLLAVRDPARGEGVRAQVDDPGVRARTSVARLDLADLSSVAAFAAGQRRAGPIDLLVNNAGVMLVSTRRLTVDGFELQMGTNHLGHFALTRQLWPTLAATARVVSLSSLAHRTAGPFDPRLGEVGPYGSFRAYAQSKLACLLFARELNRRARAAGVAVVSVAAHPGYVRTSLGNRQPNPGIVDQMTALITPLVGSAPRHGAKSQLRAA
ncbi:MAG: SDR family NAD(P)-dependent oxidoreductase, partial [Propionibacteriaceae bacterium]